MFSFHRLFASWAEFNLLRSLGRVRRIWVEVSPCD